MKKRRLGATDLEVTPIGLGTWQFSNGTGLIGGFWRSLVEGESEAVVKAALESGINWFDTAEIYGKGNSERALAKALSAAGAKPGSFRIATKWWPLLRRASNIGKSIEERLSCLSPWPIDLYQIHQPFSLSSVPAQVDAMADLVAAGKIRAVGVSNFSARSMEVAHSALARRGIPLATNQVRISLADRSIERNGLLEASRRLGVTLIAYSPLAQGLLSGRFHEEPESVAAVSTGRRVYGGIGDKTIRRTAALVGELGRVAAAHGVSRSQVALNWVINFWGEGVVAIPGASRPEQAKAAAGAMGFELESGELASLDRLSREAAASK